MGQFALSNIEDLTVQVEYDYEPAEPDVNACEVFSVIGVWVDNVDIIEAIKDEYIEGFENALLERRIGNDG